MKTKSQSIEARTKDKSNSKFLTRLSSVAIIALVLLVWQVVCMTGLVPAFMLPSPVQVVVAFVSEFPTLMQNAAITLYEAFAGLFLGLAAAFVLAIVMDNSAFLKRSVTPVLLLTQTVPTIAIAPLLVLWMGYGAAPKIALIFLTCFFPVTVGLLGGFQDADPDAIRLLQSMGAGKVAIYRHIKLPGALPAFFSGLRISTSYALVGAVIAEWLGGDRGLGVYMTRVRKAYAFDKMFAVIFLISLLSILLVQLVGLLERRAMPYKKR